MTSAEYSSHSDDGVRDRFRPPVASLIARGVQARRTVSTLVERLARLEESCRSILNDPASFQTHPESALAPRLEAWREQQLRHELEQEDLLREIQQELKELAGAVRASSESRPPEAPAAVPKAPKSAAYSGNVNYELAKQRLMAETDDSTDDAGLMDSTLQDLDASAADNVLVQKDAEIAALRKRLEEQQQLSASVDLDTAVQEERQKLQILQSNWEEKLRKSEIEISIERAKLARERTQLEEKLRNLQPADTNEADRPAEKSSEKNADRNSRGRWLARLGLLEE